MKCVISGPNIKLLGRAIQMLSKIGDEMFVMPQDDCLSFRSVNGSNSAFINVTLHNNFFSYYAYEDLEESDALKCKILIRSALAVFKVPSVLEKQVESCHIQLDPNAEHLCFVLRYKNQVIKTHLLPIIDCETIKANYKKDVPNHLCIQPKLMNDVIQNFQQNLLEITIEVNQDRVFIRNYIDDTSNISNETRTQIAFGTGEFDCYNITSDTTITFCLKELRAILHFSEAVLKPVDVHFERPGRPVVFICKSDTLETNLVLATLNPETDISSQSTASTHPQLPKKAPRRAPAKSKTGIRSISKKSFNTTKTNNTDSAQNMESMMTESPGRISDVSETASQNDRRNTMDTSRTCTPRAASSGLNTNENSVKKNPFSSMLKRKSESSHVNHDNEEVVQNSPPRNASKKAKLIFQRCFQTTLDARQLRQFDDIEVKDSDEEDDD